MRSVSPLVGTAACLVLTAGCAGPQEGDTDHARTEDSASQTPRTTVDADTSTDLWWDEAIDAVGVKAEVCGPLAGSREIEQGVFLNLGYDYPHPGRFTIVVWGAVSADLSHNVVPDSTLCASGTIGMYEGVPQIELQSAAGVTVRSIPEPTQQPVVDGDDDLIYFDWASYPYQPLAALPSEVWWEAAINMQGTVSFVCGPLAEYSQDDDSVMISLGNPAPNSDRFVLSISEPTQTITVDGEGVPTVCGEGEIETRGGISGMEILPGDTWFKSADGSLWSLYGP